eukprot:gnl/Dysnectes_brevis/8389_a14864_186.p2 GENE.gnl/Dysnectes_brevis/8389_a14864_186~~gnl/Dysnectes_brevis/8389_a14864_186.p2  ORF type:complete len:399 (-),score=118.73 gnl/Dysnectes_brevis/8389_a14864_186:1470-2666(-)
MYLLKQARVPDLPSRPYHNTVFHRAARHSPLPVLQWLHGQGMADPALRNKAGETAFYRLCQYNNRSTQTLLWFIENGLASPASNVYGNLPIHKAVMSCSPQFLRTLVKHGLTLERPNTAGKYPIELAATPQLASILVKHNHQQRGVSLALPPRPKEAFRPLSHYFGFVSPTVPYRLVLQGDPAGERELVSTMLSLQMTYKHFNIAFDCEGERLGSIDDSLRLLQFAVVFPGVDLLQPGVRLLGKADLSPSHAFMVSFPASQAVIRALRAVFTSPLACVLTYDCTNDVTSMMDAGVLPHDMGLPGSECQSTFLDAQTGFLDYRPRKSLLLVTKVMSLANVCALAETELDFGPEAGLGVDLARSHGSEFSIGGMLFDSNSYDMIASNHVFLSRAASDGWA